MQLTDVEGLRVPEVDFGKEKDHFDLMTACILPGIELVQEYIDFDFSTTSLNGEMLQKLLPLIKRDGGIGYPLIS